jgi:hypothetical protein
MKLVPAFAGVNDLVYREVTDDCSLATTKVIGRNGGQGLVRMLPPFDRTNFFLSLTEWFPEFNPIVSIAKKSSDYRVLEKITPKGFEKRTLSLIHGGGEIRLENSLRITSFREVLQYKPVYSSSVNVTYFASSEIGRESFIEQIKGELSFAGYRLRREKWEDYKIDGETGREFKATDCRDYRLVGEIEHENPFKLMSFLESFSQDQLQHGPIRLYGANKKEIAEVPLKS